MSCPRAVQLCHSSQFRTVIPAYLDQTYTPGDVGFVEASPRLIERYQLQGAASLVTVSADHTVPFRLINPTRKPVTLYRGATLGTFSQTDESLQVFSLSTKTEPTKEPQAEVPDVPVDLANADLTDSQKTELQRLINEYRDVFALSPQELGRTNLVQHHITHPSGKERIASLKHKNDELNNALMKCLSKISFSLLHPLGAAL